MNPQNNVDSQRSMDNPGALPSKPELRPGTSRDSNQTGGDRNAIRDLPKTEDDKATAGRNQGAEDFNEKHDDRKRYDEADPNWRNPDLEMDTRDINPELESNIGPQS